MNRKNKIRIYLILGIVLVIFFMLMLVFPFTKNGVFWVSILFGGISIGVQFYVQSKAFEGNTTVSKFYGFPVARIGLIYMTWQLVLSLLMSAMGQWISLKIVIIIYIIALAIGVVGLIFTDTAREEVEKQDRKLEDDTSLMRNLQITVGTILSQCEMEDIRDEIEHFDENLRFSDPISSESIKTIDQKLFSCVEDLQKDIMNKDAKAALLSCRRASAILVERNKQCKLNKK